MSGITNGIAQAEMGQNSADAAGYAADTQGRYGRQGLNTYNQIYNQSNSNYQPYIQGGQQDWQQLQDQAGPNGSLGRSFTMADFNKDPAYQFDLKQGQDAINNSNSVRGGALSGGTLKALQNYGQQQASNEYGNAQQRFVQNQNQNFGQLSSMANTGLNATNANANLGQQYATGQMAQENNLGNAAAGGILGRAAGQNQATAGGWAAMGALGNMAMMGI